jgi:hypothetical protein
MSDSYPPRPSEPLGDPPGAELVLSRQQLVDLVKTVGDHAYSIGIRDRGSGYLDVVLYNPDGEPIGEPTLLWAHGPST